MFSKISRYHSVPDVAAMDAQGRVRLTKDVRPLPDVRGQFVHTVDAGDRLDLLAYRYYSQPVRWWRICDANPEFLSPLALLGQEPIVTAQFALGTSWSDLAWADVFGALRGIAGVEDVRAQEDVTLVPTQQATDGQTMTVLVESYTRVVLVTYNRLSASAETLAAALAEAGFAVETPTVIGQLGRPIVIPPNTAG